MARPLARQDVDAVTAATKLRHRAIQVRGAGALGGLAADLVDAADEIERLENEIARVAPTSAALSREQRLERVVRWLLSGKPWGAFIATESHGAGTGWTLEDEAKDALHG